MVISTQSVESLELESIPFLLADFCPSRRAEIGQKLPFTTHESVELASNSGRLIIESFTHEKI